jgi:hypothetical protein
MQVKRSWAWPQWPQSGPPHRRLGCHFLGLSLSGGEVHHQDPLRLERELVPQRRVQLDIGSGLLAS